MSTTTTADEEFLTDVEVGAWVKLGRPTLIGWRATWPADGSRTGTGPPFIRLAGSVRYRRSDVIEWIDQQ